MSQPIEPSSHTYRELDPLQKPTAHPADDLRAVNLLLRYGQHSHFWNEVDGLRSSSDAIAQTLDFIDKQNYGAIEGIAKAKFEFLSRNDEFWQNNFDTVSLGFEANSLAGGEVYNRISPKLRGYLTWDLAFVGIFLTRGRDWSRRMELFIGERLRHRTTKNCRRRRA